MKKQGNLVLTRYVGDRLVLRFGDKEIIIELVETRGRRARLSIQADRDVEIHRYEVLTKLGPRNEDNPTR